MKISMIDKVLAIGLVLAVYGITLKADHNVNRKVTIDQKDKVEVKANKKKKQKETVDYYQIREEYQWDLEGAGERNPVLGMPKGNSGTAQF